MQCVESAIRDACDDNMLVTQATDSCATVLIPPPPPSCRTVVVVGC